MIAPSPQIIRLTTLLRPRRDTAAEDNSFPSIASNLLLLDSQETRMLHGEGSGGGMLGQTSHALGTEIQFDAASGFVVGDFVLVYDTVAYNGVWEILATPTTETAVIGAPFDTNEALGGWETLVAPGAMLAGWENGVDAQNNAWISPLTTRFGFDVDGLYDEAGGDLGLRTVLTAGGQFNLFLVAYRETTADNMAPLWQRGAFDNGIVLASDANLYISISGTSRSAAVSPTGLFVMRVWRDGSNQLRVQATGVAATTVGATLSGALTGLDQIGRQNSVAMEAASRIKHVSFFDDALGEEEVTEILDWIETNHGVTM